MLMQLGALATIGVQQPRNLSIVVLDNECYGETGRQRTTLPAVSTLPASRGRAASRTRRWLVPRKTSPIFDTRCMRAMARCSRK